MWIERMSNKWHRKTTHVLVANATRYDCLRDTLCLATTRVVIGHTMSNYFTKDVQIADFAAVAYGELSFWKTFCSAQKHFMLIHNKLQKVLENFYLETQKKSPERGKIFAVSLARISPFSYLCTEFRDTKHKQSKKRL